MDKELVLDRSECYRVMLEASADFGIGYDKYSGFEMDPSVGVFCKFNEPSNTPTLFCILTNIL